MSFFGGGGGGSAPPSTTTNYVREAPGIEERKIELMDIARQVAQKPINLPDYQVAGLGALEQQGINNIQSGEKKIEIYVEDEAGSKHFFHIGSSCRGTCNNTPFFP